MVCPVIGSGSCTLEGKHVRRLFLLTKLTEALGHLQLMACKAAASGMIALPASGGIVLPGVRVAVGVVLLLVFLLVCWLRCATTTREAHECSG